MTHCFSSMHSLLTNINSRKIGLNWFWSYAERDARQIRSSEPLDLGITMLLTSKGEKIAIQIRCLHHAYIRVFYEFTGKQANYTIDGIFGSRIRIAPTVSSSKNTRRASTSILSASTVHARARARAQSPSPSRTHWCLGRPRGRGPRWYGPRTASSASMRACPEASASPGTAKLRCMRHRRLCTRACALAAYILSSAIACARLQNRTRFTRSDGPRARPLNVNVNKTALHWQCNRTAEM